VSDDVIALLTPLCDSEPVELANNVYRKQVIRHGRYDYKGRKLEFTPDYTRKLVDAYRAGAYDAVPLQFAGSDNAHTNDVERTRGEILGFEPSPDGTGLDAIVKADDGAAKIIDRYPKLPVSVRILENYERADGKRFPAAIQHVLATWDPRLTGMSPWRRVEMSNEDVDHVLDLTEVAAPPAGAEEEGAAVPDTSAHETQGLSDADLAKLAQLVTAQLIEAADEDEADDEPDDGYEPPTDEELEAMARASEADDDEPEEVAASNGPSTQEIELANRLDRMEVENARLRRDAAERSYVELSRSLAEIGIPPAVTDIVKPWLVDARPIELSNGASRTPADDIVKAFKEIAAQVKLVDLSGPEPVFAAAGLNESDPVEQRSADRKWADSILDEYGLR
jgi:hypothetical protein